MTVQHDQPQADIALPDSWAVVELGEIATINPGANVDRLHDGDEVSFVPMKAVEEQTGVVDVSETRALAAVRKGYTSFQDGDLLFAKITPCMENGKVAIVNGLMNGCGFGSTEFHVIRLLEPSVAKFYFYFLVQESLRRDARSKMTGTAGQLRVPARFMESIRVPLPPVAEARRIVEKLEELLTDLDAGLAALHQAKHLVAKYRLSVLKAAVEGDLSRAWREASEGANEHAGEFLSRIEAEQARLPRAARRKKAQPLAKLPAGLSSLPEGWVWSPLPALGVIGRGKSKHRPRNDPRLLGGPYPFIQTGDVRKANGFIRAHSATYSEFGLSQSRLWATGTLCITIAANIAETGILTYSACFPDSVVGFTNHENPLVVRWVETFIRTERGRLESFAPATAQKNINLDTLTALMLPLPPESEIAEIIDLLDRRISGADELEVTVDREIRRAAKLRQSILKQAFTGQLEPQDPTDEPVAELLERIREAKEHKKPTVRRGRAPGKKEVAHV